MIAPVEAKQTNVKSQYQSFIVCAKPSSNSWLNTSVNDDWHSYGQMNERLS